MPVPYKTGATTNPFLVEALIDLLKSFGIKHITIAEGAVVGESTSKSFKTCGYEEISERKGVELIDLKKDEFVPLTVPDPKALRILKIPKTIAFADIVINIPVLKTHDCFPVTLGIKNMKGVIHERDKKKFHLWDLAQCIVDLNKVVLPNITIIDGTIGMEGMGPIYGEPANMNLIIASFDTLAGDIIGCKIMGVDPNSVKYIKLAEKQGLGAKSFSEIKVLGQKTADVKKDFKRITLESVLKSKDFKKYGIKLVDKGACSGCRNVITSLLSDIKDSNKFEKIENITFFIGKGIKEKDLKNCKGKPAFFGSCTKGIKKDKSLYMPGCPPHVLHVKKILGYRKEDFDNFSFLKTHLKHFGF